MAHGFESSHPIFETPIDIKLQFESFETPVSYFGYRSGQNLGNEMPGIRIYDKEQTPISFQVGTVYSPQSFEEAPDAEWISSGINSRSSRSVAIGRHANCLGWGFAVDPGHMTTAARAMFVNSIVYISRFDHQTPLLKVPRAMLGPSSIYAVPRDSLYDRATYLSTAAARYQQEQTITANQQRTIERISAIQDQRDLTQYEKLYLQMAERRVARAREEEETESEYVERFFKRTVGSQLYRDFGQDIEKYRIYYNQYGPTVYYDTNKYDFVVDEDLKQRGIPVGDVRILETAIEMLEADNSDKVAMRLLRRYTNERFRQAHQWRAWFEENKGRLFFHEIAGYKFFVDTRDRAAGPERSAQATPSSTEASHQPAQPAETGNQHPVLVNCRADSTVVSPGQAVTLSIEFDIHPGWHIYNEGDEQGICIPTTVEVQLPGGVEFVSDWEKSIARPGPSGTRIFEKQAVWKRQIKVLESATAEVLIPVTIRYMACNVDRCQPVEVLERNVMLKLK